MINCFFKLIAASRGFACYLHECLVILTDGDLLSMVQTAV